MDKNTKQMIKSLKKQGDFEKIYHEYGANEFRKNVSRRYQKEDLKKLSKEGKYEDIFLRYGTKTYNEYLHKAKKREIELETGSKLKSIIYEMKYILKRFVAPVILSLGVALPSGTIAFSESIINDNHTKYETEIMEYEKSIKDYSNEIKALEIDNELELIMKVMDDMWSRIEGYGTPEKDIIGYMGLDLAQEGAIGVCRNMADDTCRRLNEINPKFNARTISVHMSGNGLELADIERNIIESNNTVQEQEDVQDEVVDSKNIANHLVVAIDSIENNVTIIIDPTNPSIGVYYNHNIEMFNKTQEGNYSLKRIVWQDLLLNGIEGVEDVIKGFKETRKSFEELNEIYGVEAQNLALENIRKLEVNQEKEKTFREELKISVNGLNITVDMQENINSQEIEAR